MIASITWTALAVVGTVFQAYALIDARDDLANLRLFRARPGMLVLATLHWRTAALRLAVCAGNAAIGAFSLAVPHLAAQIARDFGYVVIGWLLVAEAVLIYLTFTDRQVRRRLASSRAHARVDDAEPEPETA